MTRRFVLTMIAVATLLVGVGALAGCGAPAPYRLFQSTDAWQAVQPPYRSPLEIGTCEEASEQFDPQLLQATNAWIAAGIEQAARANSGTLSLVVSYADARPMAPASTPLAVTLPAIDGYPAAPTLEPIPTKTGQPWKDAQAAQQVQARNQAKLDTYHAAVEKIDTQVSAAQTLAHQTAQALRTLQPPQDLASDHTSLWGCVVEQSQRLQAFSGDKVLLLATTANEQSFADVASLTGLKGARLIAINTECVGTASWCEWSRGTWQAEFSKAQVASQTWLDAGQTAVTSPAVVFDPQ